jgi:uncharacterized protein (DUF433 family)
MLYAPGVDTVPELMLPGDTPADHNQLTPDVVVLAEIVGFVVVHEMNCGGPAVISGSGLTVTLILELPLHPAPFDTVTEYVPELFTDRVCPVPPALQI